MKNENLIHIKLDYNEAVQAKRDVLSTEMNLLKLIRKVKRYQSLRAEELQTKARTHRKMQELKTNISKLQTILPKIKIPNILKNEIETEKKAPKIKKKIKDIKKQQYDDDLDIQLQEIQRKLRELS